MSKAENAEQKESKGRGREWSASFKRTVKGYTMPDLEFKSAPIEGTLPFVAKTLEEAYNKLGLSQDEIVLSLNNTAKAKMIAEKTEGALGADAIPEQVLNKFIESLKSIPRIAALNVNDTPAEKKAVFEACIVKVKSDPDLLAALGKTVEDSKNDQEQE